MTPGYVTAEDMTVEDLERELKVKLWWRERARLEHQTADEQVRDLQAEIDRRKTGKG